MHFTTLFAALGAASVLTSVAAGPIQTRGMTASQVVVDIGIITSKSRSLQGQANMINQLSPALYEVKLGPLVKVIAGLEDLISVVNIDIMNTKGAQSFTIISDENSILQALSTAVTVQQELLNILIGKGGLLSELPAAVEPPTAERLGSLKNTLDAYISILINLCGDTAYDLTAQMSKLDNTFNIAIAQYTPVI